VNDGFLMAVLDKPGIITNLNDCMNTENHKIKIMVADDQGLILHSLVNILEAVDDFDVIGTAQNGLMLLHLLEEKKPDVIIIDINMPKMSGIEVTKIIDGKMPWIKIIALSMYSHPQYIKEMLRHGAKGFLSKNCLPEELFSAIRAVNEGKTYLDKQCSDIILHNFSKVEQDIKSDLQSLTAREIEVIRALADGMVTREIAQKLFISDKTVERHKTNILKKLELRNTAQLIKVAVEQGILIQ
jgi:DNA-binding NarL/FixJ family response regulator